MDEFVRKSIWFGKFHFFKWMMGLVVGFRGLVFKGSELPHFVLGFLVAFEGIEVIFL